MLPDTALCGNTAMQGFDTHTNARRADFIQAAVHGGPEKRKLSVASLTEMACLFTDQKDLRVAAIKLPLDCRLGNMVKNSNEVHPETSSPTRELQDDVSHKGNKRQ